MLRGSKALVTGASRGIGYAIASALAKNNCSVVITGRNEKTLLEAAKSIGENVIPMVWDASEISLAAQKVNEAAKNMGGLDIVVNNVGIFKEDWNLVMKVNAGAVFFTMQAAVKYMLENNIRGNILNVSSAAGYEPAYEAYRASKTAVNNLTRGWGKMFAPDGITINGIAPGPVATEMNNWHEGDSMKNDRIPFGRFATVDEIASLAMYLLSREAEMICGETVVIDGAYHIR